MAVTTYEIANNKHSWNTCSRFTSTVVFDQKSYMASTIVPNNFGPANSNATAARLINEQRISHPNIDLQSYSNRLITFIEFTSFSSLIMHLLLFANDIFVGILRSFLIILCEYHNLQYDLRPLHRLYHIS